MTVLFKDTFDGPTPDPFWNLGPGDVPLYEDTFDGTALKPFWVPDGPLPTVSDGVMHTLTGQPSGNYVQMTTPTFDARGKEVVIEAIPHVWNGSDNSDRDFLLYAAGGQTLSLEVYQDQFGNYPGWWPNPYDPVAHRWWKLAVSVNGLTGYVSTSPDGVVWTLRQTVDTTGWDWTTAHAYIDAGNNPGANTDVQWDNFSVKPSTNTHQSGGTAHTTPITSNYDANYMAGPLDLRGKSVVIEAIPDGVRGVDRYLAVQDGSPLNPVVNSDQIEHDSTSAAQGGLDPDTLFYGGHPPNDVTTWTQAPYDPVAHRWWRIRTPADGSASFLDASPDGVTWTSLGRSTSTWDRSQAYLVFGAGQYAGPRIPADTDVQWDNFSMSEVGPVELTLTSRVAGLKIEERPASDLVLVEA